MGVEFKMPKTPNLDKMLAVKERAEICSEFLDWLRDIKHAHLMVWQEAGYKPCHGVSHQAEAELERYCRICGGGGTLLQTHEGWIPMRPSNPEEFLAEFFEVDYREAERERVRILDELGKQA